jgi:hypothetical protein
MFGHPSSLIDLTENSRIFQKCMTAHTAKRPLTVKLFMIYQNYEKPYNKKENIAYLGVGSL